MPIRIPERILWEYPVVLRSFFAIKCSNGEALAISN